MDEDIDLRMAAGLLPLDQALREAGLDAWLHHLPGDVPVLRYERAKYDALGNYVGSEFVADPQKPNLYDHWRDERPVKFNLTLDEAVQVVREAQASDD